MKLHLGCGQRYLDGYRNIDFPPAQHTVQVHSIADEFGDLTCLRYPFSSIEEVRLHHVFEHFPRPVAAGLMAAWFFWLKPNGVLRIEVPDFTRTAMSVLNPLNGWHAKMVGIRHIFGSHEAGWAVHCEGWSRKSLSSLMNCIGFRVIEVQKSHWRSTYNIEIVGAKQVEELSLGEIEKKVRVFFSNYILDPTEERLLDVWMEMFRAQLNKCLLPAAELEGISGPSDQVPCQT